MIYCKVSEERDATRRVTGKIDLDELRRLLDATKAPRKQRPTLAIELPLVHA